MWPLRVGAAHTQPSSGFLAISQRVSRIFLSRGVIGRTRRAAVALPRVTSGVPYLRWPKCLFPNEVENIWPKASIGQDCCGKLLGFFDRRDSSGIAAKSASKKNLRISNSRQ
jgi:hypothetical protein